MNDTQLKAYITEAYPDLDIILADGLAEAFIGVAQQFHQYFAVYSREHVIHLLMDGNAWSEEQAEEFFDFNITGAYVGESTPAFVSIPICPECGRLRHE